MDLLANSKELVAVILLLLIVWQPSRVEVLVAPTRPAAFILTRFFCLSHLCGVTAQK